MTQYLLYLLEVSFCMVIFWVFYSLVLKRFTLFTFRRIFLLSAMGLSWLLPLSNFSFTHHEGKHPIHEIGTQVFLMEQVVLDQVKGLTMQIQQEPSLHTEGSMAEGWTLSLETLLGWVYALGIFFFLAKFLMGLWDVMKEAIQMTWQARGRYWMGITQHPTSYSFGPFLFLSHTHQNLGSKELNTLIAHEEAHIKQLHTLDIVLIKLQQAICWINPLWVLWDKEMRILHECSADRLASSALTKMEYAQFLLKVSVLNPTGSLTHAFANVGLKQRVRQLFIPDSSQWNTLWMLPAMGICLILSVGFSFIRQGEVVPSPLHHYLQEIQQAIPPTQAPYLAPLKNPAITSGYGKRINPRTGEEQFHYGIDFRGALGTPVYATGDGIVYMGLGRTNFSQGWYVEINHGEGLFSHYANLLGIRSEDSIPVRQGDQVKAGDLIGYVGNSGKYSTGPHLHYEIRKGSDRLNPMDFLPKDIKMGKSELIEEHLNGFSPLQAVPHLAPVKNPILMSGFGMRKHPVLKVRKMHMGVDFVADLRTEIFATGDGEVIFAGRKGKGGYGYQIELQHGIGSDAEGKETSLKTKYAHLDVEGVLVKVGEMVKAGQLIGYSGNSGLSKGPHLHYEVIKNNKRVDPMKYMAGDFPETQKGSMD